jgi:hypothetical protein
MSSDRESLIAALEAIENGCKTVAGFPLETLSRTEGNALLTRLDQLDQKLVAVQRRMSGRLLTITRSQRTPA